MTERKATALSFGLLVAAFSTFPSNLRAQEQAAGQTAEGAQRFLTTLLPMDFIVQVPNGSVSSRRTSPVTSTDSDCGTQFTYNHISGSASGQVLQSGLNWRSVADVRHSEGSSSVTVSFRDFAMSYHFDFRSAAVAARAAFAMEFLRQHCDPAASTGF